MHFIHFFPGVQPGDAQCGPFFGRQQLRRVLFAGPFLPGEEAGAHAVALHEDLLVQAGFSQLLRQVHGLPDILLPVVADGDQQGVLHAGGFLQGFPQLLQAPVVPVQGGQCVRACHPVVVPRLVQVDQVDGGEVRFVPPDRVRPQGGGVIAQVRFGDALPDVPVPFFPGQQVQRASVAQCLEHRVLPLQGMDLREEPAHGFVFAVHGPQDRAVLPARLLHRVKQRGDPDMLPLPVPDPLRLGHAGLRRLVLAHAGPVRLAAGDHGHMDRVGQRGKDRLHPGAGGSFPQHFCQESLRADPSRIGSEERVQRNQYDFAHSINLMQALCCGDDDPHRDYTTGTSPRTGRRSIRFAHQGKRNAT